MAYLPNILDRKDTDCFSRLQKTSASYVICSFVIEVKTKKINIIYVWNSVQKYALSLFVLQIQVLTVIKLDYARLRALLSSYCLFVFVKRR